MVGRAVETIVWSSAASSIPPSSAPILNHKRRPDTVSGRPAGAVAVLNAPPNYSALAKGNASARSGSIRAASAAS